MYIQCKNWIQKQNQTRINGILQTLRESGRIYKNIVFWECRYIIQVFPQVSHPHRIQWQWKCPFALQEMSQNNLWKRKGRLMIALGGQWGNKGFKWQMGERFLYSHDLQGTNPAVWSLFSEAWLYQILLCACSPSLVIPISLVCDCDNTHLHSLGHINMMKAFYTNVFPLPLPINGAGKGSSISGPFPWVLIPTKILKLNLSLHNGLNYRESTTAYIINKKSPAQAADHSAKSCRFNLQWVEPELKKHSIFLL